MSNELIKQDRTRREEQLVFINSGQVFGIQNANISYQTNETYLKFLGANGATTIIPNGAEQGQASFSALLVGNDPFLPLLRNTGFNGFILQSPKTHSGNFSFGSGYVVSYSNKCSIGQIPQIDAEILIVGNIGKLLQKESAIISGSIANISGVADNFVPRIPGPGTLEITLDDYNTNRVIAYDLRITAPRLVTYALGKRHPTSVDLNYPLVMDLSFQFEVDNYQAHRMNAFPCSPKVRDLELKIKTFDKNEKIAEFLMFDANLIAESYSAGIDNNAVITATYRQYLPRGFEATWGLDNVSWSAQAASEAYTVTKFGLTDESGLLFKGESGNIITTS